MIKSGRYHMPNFLSDDVKDLINKMLQPNPIRRISIDEIMDHPWFAENVPIYILKQDYSLSTQFDVDQEIVAHIMKLEMSNQGLT
jgi:serine/threonine protein kinase